MHTANQTNSFKALVVANRRAGRLSEPVAPEAPDASKLMKQSGMRLMACEMDQAKLLADGECRSAGNFMRWIYLRGLHSYLAEQGSATAAPAAQ